MVCTGADLHVHHWPTVVNDTEINSQGSTVRLGPEDLLAMRQSADDPPQSDVGEAALVQQASVARSWPWTSPAGLGGVMPSARTTRQRRSVGVANNFGEPTGEVLENERTSVLSNQKGFRRRPGLSTGMLAQPDDRPGRGGELQQAVQQRGPDEPVHSRTTADAATS
jgi:hypothetical protein